MSARPLGCVVVAVVVVAAGGGRPAASRRWGTPRVGGGVTSPQPPSEEARRVRRGGMRAPCGGVGQYRGSGGVAEQSGDAISPPLSPPPPNYVSFPPPLFWRGQAGGRGRYRPHAGGRHWHGGWRPHEGCGLVPPLPLRARRCVWSRHRRRALADGVGVGTRTSAGMVPHRARRAVGGTCWPRHCPGWAGVPQTVPPLAQRSDPASVCCGFCVPSMLCGWVSFPLG